MGKCVNINTIGITQVTIMLPTLASEVGKGTVRKQLFC